MTSSLKRTSACIPISTAVTAMRRGVSTSKPRLNPILFALLISVVAVSTAMPVTGQTFTLLHTFSGTDGNQPGTALVQTTSGAFYGTTSYGGANGDGAIYKIAPDGSFATVYSFSGPDGSGPGPLIQASDGNLYGTTVLGGDDNLGTVFKMTLGGTLTTLHSFSGGKDGGYAYAGVVEGSNGLFYGTTDGTVKNTAFAISSSGEFTTFAVPQGFATDGPLIQASDGNFYGTVQGAGAPGDGVAFRMTPEGDASTIYTFCLGGVPCSDGQYPQAGLVQATNGYLYGNTTSGGTTNCSGRFDQGCGTIYQLSLDGTLVTLHSFDSTDGDFTLAGLIQATSGDLLGVTYFGGTGAGCTGMYGCGTIFEISPEGDFTSLYSFCACAGGYWPLGALIQGTNGLIYGTASYGGANSDGTIFSFDLGLGPFVKTNPTSGAVGSSVIVLGTNLTEASGVSFNGTPASFTVISPGAISATVPSGATSGTVEVTTPGMTLDSNVPFAVVP
jgi:uncharacterized repeat protein (TIGR03803 family)